MTREDAIRIAEANARLPLYAFIALNEAAAELSRAMGVHGPMRGMHEGYAVILEELDELWDEIKKHNPDKKRIRAEALQVAAMALRFVADVCAGETE